jgi:hypothetical protein
MAFFDFFGGSSGDSRTAKLQIKKIESLEKSAEDLKKTISDLELRLQETQLIVQYIAQANNALATDMATIYESLRSVMEHFSEDPLAKWGLNSWGDDDDDDEGNGGGWLN